MLAMSRRSLNRRKFRPSVEVLERRDFLFANGVVPLPGGWPLGPPVHEQITSEALSFLTPSALSVVQEWNVNVDVFDIATGLQHPEHHFDGSAFSQSVAFINSEYHDAVEKMNPAAHPRTGEIVDAMKHFGTLLHPVQDFYAHTNWIENVTRVYDKDEEPLVDTHMTYWDQGKFEPYADISPWPKGYTVNGIFSRDEIPIVLVLQGDGPTGLFFSDGVPIPPGLISRSEASGSSGVDRTLGFHYFNFIDESPFRDFRFLVSGDYEGEPSFAPTSGHRGVACYRSTIEGTPILDGCVQNGLKLSHEDYTLPNGDVNRGFAKDRPIRKDGTEEPYFDLAVKYATRQTRHEFGRLVRLVNSQYGSNAVRTLFQVIVQPNAAAYAEAAAVSGIAVEFVPLKPWYNIFRAADVNDDSHVVAGDVLEIVNYINAFGSTRVPMDRDSVSVYLDVSGDNFVAPNDALEIINLINAGLAEAEGEPTGQAANTSETNHGKTFAELDYLALLVASENMASSGQSRRRS